MTRPRPTSSPRYIYAFVACLAATIVILGWLRAFGLF